MRASLDFDLFRNFNVHRCVDESGFQHPLQNWSVLEWGGATGGEIGEAQNIAKKIKRIRGGTRGNLKGETETALLISLADEVADGVVYADLWLASEGFSLGESIQRVWNRKADEIGYRGPRL